MKEIALCSFYSVAKLVLVVLAGVWLGRRGILDKAGRQSLSRLIMTLFLPCLLVDSLSRNANLDNLCKWGAMALAAPVFCAAGFLLGHLCARLLKVPRSQHRYIAVSNSFGNSSFLPMPLLATICAVAPAALLGEPGADQRSFAYISIYLTVHSPLIWLFAYPYMTGVPLRELGWRRLLNPPLFGS
ncbi:MAG: AEC family transporter, partial [Victivallales bacterium]|nr:AEC family transporter [Victivallales bacterium]